MSRHFGSFTRAMVAAVALALSLNSGLALASPAVGDEAPPFRLVGSDGNYYTLEQFKAKKPVVIAFFPKAFTGG